MATSTNKTQHPEYQYLRILEELLSAAPKKGPQDDPTTAVFVRTMRFDLSGGKFPLLTTKKVFWKNVVAELLWNLRGESKLDFLHEQGVTMWDPWATKEISEPLGLEAGDVGPIYGPNWIHWQTADGREINQIEWIVNGLKKHPEWRRWKATTWNPGNLDKAFLAPCHGDIMCFAQDGVLSLHMSQRSGDFFVGVPYNIGMYSLLLLMLAQVTGHKPGEFVHTVLDAHLYASHKEGAREQLKREPRPFPKVTLTPEITDIFNFTMNDFTLEEYDPHPFIKVDVAL